MLKNAYIQYLRACSGIMNLIGESDWTCANQVQVLDFFDGVSVDQAISHDWTSGQVKALCAGVNIEQAL